MRKKRQFRRKYLRKYGNTFTQEVLLKLGLTNNINSNNEGIRKPSYNKKD